LVSAVESNMINNRRDGRFLEVNPHARWGVVVMREFLATGAVLGLTAGLLLTGPAAGDTVRYSDGPATMTLDACDTVQSGSVVDNCSYLSMKYEGKPYYTYVTAPGALSWQGALAGSALSFPEKSWPTLTKLYLSTATFTTGPIAGTIDSAGVVRMQFDYSILINALGDLCTLSGTADLRSDGVEWVSGAGVGHEFDPQTGRFAVTSSAFSPTTATGACSRVTGFAYDIATGVGWYLAGTLTIPPPGPDQSQTAVLTAPKRINLDGKTVLLPAAVVTNAGQTALATVTWGTKPKAAGTKSKWARLKVSKAGKVTLRKSGKAKRLYVKLLLHAPAVEGYTAYDYAKTWQVRAG